MDPRMGQPASKLGPLSACQQNVIRMAFQWQADNGPIVRAYWVSISYESYMYLFLDPGYVLFWCSVCFRERLILHWFIVNTPHFPKNLGLKTLFPNPCWWMPKIKKKKIQMHIAQLEELDVHKTKQKRNRNRTTTSLVLDSSMQRP